MDKTLLSRISLVLVLLFSFLFSTNSVFAQNEEPPPCDCTPNSFAYSGNCTSCNYRVNYYYNCDCSTYPQTDYDESCRDIVCPPPTNPYPANGAVNTQTPGIMGWRDIRPFYPLISFYYYQIGGLSSQTSESEIIFSNCELSPNTSYSWGVKSCASSGNCGNFSYWFFTTGNNPGLKSPLPNKTGVTFPVNFQWCPVPGLPEVTAYFFKANDVIGYIIRPATTTATFSFASGLTKNTSYQWQVASCFDLHGFCTDRDNYGGANFSQQWNFTTVEEWTIPSPPLVRPLYNPAEPDKIPVVSTFDYLEWMSMRDYGARSYRFEIKRGGANVIPDELSMTTSLAVSFNLLWDYLEYDATYDWRVQSCLETDGTDCDDFSDFWKFQTPSKILTLIAPSPADGATNLAIPVSFYWNVVEKVNFYQQELSLESNFDPLIELPDQGKISQSVFSPIKVTFNYPTLKMNQTYYFRVKACFDKEGIECGNWASRTFTTGIIPPPNLLSPEAGAEEIGPGPIILRWGRVNDGWTGDWHKYWLVSEGITIKREAAGCCTAYFDRLELEKNYQWKVRSCLAEAKTVDEEAEKCGGWSEERTFRVIELIPPGTGGLVPCGRRANVEDPYDIDETEPCGFKHLFLLLRNIIDFILWRLGLIILALLSVATGVIFYFSMGAPETMAKVKSIWKSAGLGYLIIFLGHTFINIILAILGYKIGVFGPWWIISF